jgi:hypothetical protein
MHEHNESGSTDIKKQAHRQAAASPLVHLPVSQGGVAAHQAHRLSIVHLLLHREPNRHLVAACMNGHLTAPRRSCLQLGCPARALQRQQLTGGRDQRAMQQAAAACGGSNVWRRRGWRAAAVRDCRARRAILGPISPLACVSRAYLRGWRRSRAFCQKVGAWCALWTPEQPAY